MTDRQMAVREATALVQPKGFDDATKELIRKTVSDPRNPLSTDEFDLFIQVCQHIGANPLLREAYALKDRGGRFSVAIGIDKFRQQTQADPRFLGQAGPYWAGKDGVWKDVWLDDAPPLAARVGIWLRGAREPTWGVATLKAYRRESPQWKDNPAHMLAIRAEAQAHRKCSSRLSGPVVLREEEEAERPAYVDADGVIDEGHPDREEPHAGLSPRMQQVKEELDSAIAEGEAVELGQGPGVVPVTEATRLACAAFVDEVKEANARIRVALPAEDDGEAAWQVWLAEKRGAWSTSPHNPKRVETVA